MSPASRYPLVAVEELRRRILDEARAELARATAEADGARRRAAESERAVAAASARRREGERTARGATAAEWEAHGRWVARLRGNEQALAAEAGLRGEEAVRSAAQEERRRGALAEAERQLRTVELHRERWEAERRRRARLAEEAEQEDRSVARPGRHP